MLSKNKYRDKVVYNLTSHQSQRSMIIILPAVCKLNFIKSFAFIQFNAFTKRKTKYIFYYHFLMLYYQKFELQNLNSMKSFLIQCCEIGNRFDKVKITGLQIKLLYYFSKFLCTTTTILTFVLILKLPILKTLSLKNHLMTSLQYGASQYKIVFYVIIYGIIFLSLIFLLTFQKSVRWKWLKFKFTVFLLVDLNTKPVAIILCYIIKLQTDFSFNSILLIAGITIIFFGFLIFSIGCKFFVISNKYFCENQLQKRKCTSLKTFQIIEIIGLIIVSFYQHDIDDSQLSQCLVFLFMFFGSFFKFSKFKLIIVVNIKQRVYINEQTNIINNFVITLDAITSLVIFLTIIINAKIINQNIMYLLMVSYCFSIFAIKNYLAYRRSQFKMKEPEQLLDQNQVVFYLQTLFDLIKSKNQDRQNQMIFIALKKSHQFQCENANCYCSNQNYKQDNNFQRKFIEQVLDKIQLKFSKNKKICLKVQYFRYQYYKNSYKTYNKLQQFKQDNDEIYIEVFILNLQQNVKNNIKFRQNQVTKSNLQLELPFIVEQTNQKLWNLIKNDIEIRMLKWNYLYQGNCNSIELQKYVTMIRSNMSQAKKICRNHFQNFKQNQNFIFLMYFYFNSVSFSRKQTDLLFKIISQKLKYTKRNSSSDEKEIVKLLITDKCDVFLIDIKNPEGFILNCTKTIQKNLSYNKKQLLDKKLKTIIPSTYYENHNNVIQNWKNNTNIKMLQSMKEVLVIDKKMNVLTAYLKLKVLLHEGKYCIVSALFYQNSQKVFLLNNKKQIQFSSEELSNIFLQKKLKSFKIPFQLLLLNNNQFNACLSTNQEKSLQVTFINLNKYKHEVVEILYKLENIQSKQAYQIQIIKKNLINNFKKFINQQANKWFVNTKIKFIRKTMNGHEYFIVKILSIQSRQVSSTKQIKQNQQKMLNFTEKMILQKTNIQQQNSQKDQSQNSSLPYQNQSEGEDIQKSITSSAQNHQNISFYNLMDALAFKSQNSTNIFDKRLFVYSFQVILISIVGIIILNMSYYLNCLGFAQIQDVYFADGAVSDNMQLFQFTYNRLMSLKQHINDQEMFNSILESAKIQKDQVYSLLFYDVLSLNSQKTLMQGLKYYQYLNHQIDWQGQTGLINQVTILRFFQNLNYITSRIYNEGYPNNQTDLINMLKLFEINFDKLKQINHNQLAIYQNYSISTLNLLYWITLSIVSFHIFFVLYMIIMFKRNNSFRFEQKINCLNIYTYIPTYELLQIKSYYQMLFESSKNKIDENPKELIKLSTQKLNLNHQQIPQKHGIESNQFRIHNVHKSYIWVFYLFVFSIVNVSYFFGTYTVISLYQPCQVMMDSVNDLMGSQNFLIQSYFDFKAQYLIKNNTFISQKYVQQFLANLDKSVVAFAQITSQQSILFKSYDPSFHEAYKKLLIQNSCTLDYGSITDYQYQKCVQDLSNADIGKGVVAGMVYAQRTIQKHVYQSLNKTYTYDEAVNLFNGADFKQIDQSLIYMFRLYQVTQAQIYSSLNYDIQNALTRNFYFCLLQMILLFFLVIWVFYNYKEQKIQLGKLYEGFLLIPVEVAQKIGSWRKIIIQFLEYDENK